MRNEKGQFKEGAPGRPPGTKNKNKIAWDVFGDLINGPYSGRAQEILNKCTDREFMDYYLKILKFFKGEMKSIDLGIDLEKTFRKIKFSDFDTED